MNSTTVVFITSFKCTLGVIYWAITGGRSILVVAIKSTRNQTLYIYNGTSNTFIMLRTQYAA